jgi:putative ABC transport system ATP-binding protein
LANRVFDIMTIQKATAILLMDGITIVLTTILGLLLLSFYHPFLLGFSIVLVISMIAITWLLGRGGIRTAIEESQTKYRIAYWLQDVLSSPAAFKVNGGESLAIERANMLAAQYIDARQRQFRVVIRQIAFAIGLQVLASTAVLGLGGWLVIQGQLTLGQLVASELVVTVVVSAFAKAGKSFEKFYDLMAGVEKVGHLLDVPVDPRREMGSVPDGPAELRWNDLLYHQSSGTSRVAAAEIKAAARVAIVGNDVGGRSLLAKTVAGLTQPDSGFVEVAGFDSKHASFAGGGRVVAYAGTPDIFHATLQENVDLSRPGVGQNRVREALQAVGLWNTVLRLPDGLRTVLESNGYPLASHLLPQLIIARAIVGSPRVLVIDRLLDELEGLTLETVWNSVAEADARWTLVVVTTRPEIAERCDTQVAVHAR